MKFAHIADCHLGSWGSHPELRDLPLKAFEQAVNACITEKVGFVLIAGDLFDTSMPGVDVLRFAAEQLRKCRDNGIAVYIIAGSHDYSPTGKTMISVMESAGLVVNVNQKLINHNGAKIFGIEGLKGGLDKNSFNDLKIPELGSGLKIFAFHSAVTEHCPISLMDSIPLSVLPKGFDYYATGHLHEHINENIGKAKLVFPGPLFQANFDELEKHEKTGFYIVSYETASANNGFLTMKRIELDVCKSFVIKIDGNGKSPVQIEEEILSMIENNDIKNKIVLIKCKGILESGKPSDINFNLISERCKNSGCFAVKKSVNLTTEEIDLKTQEKSVKEIESDLMKQAVANQEDKKDMIPALMDLLNQEKTENEKNLIYEERIKSAVIKMMGL
ncbi:MAG: DNA repair exonuclease [Candidatus Aenigmarchaeota archaeon]|nr:DNA repair exonuclease [Candidatus Aenigmarchaeota archaeon]